jgi:hypothetical protein
LRVAAGVLVQKLIARETDNHKPALTVRFPKLFQSRVLRRKPAFTRGVDNQQNFAGIIRHFDFASAYRGISKAID